MDDDSFNTLYIYAYAVHIYDESVEKTEKIKYFQMSLPLPSLLCVRLTCMFCGTFVRKSNIFLSFR
jgi:hypothetical protein